MTTRIDPSPARTTPRSGPRPAARARTARSGRRRAAPALRPRGRARPRAACTRSSAPSTARWPPSLLHDDVPVWVVLGHSENLHMVAHPLAVFTRDSRRWRAVQDGTRRPRPPAHARSSPGSPSAPSPRATSTSGCAARSPTPWRRIDHRGRPPPHQPRTPTAWSTSSAQDGQRRPGQPVRRAPADAGDVRDPRHARGVRRPAGAGRPRHAQGHRDRHRQQRRTSWTPWTGSSPRRRAQPDDDFTSQPHRAPGRAHRRRGRRSTCAWSCSPPTRPPPTSSPTCCAWCSPTRASAPSSTAAR